MRPYCKEKSDETENEHSEEVNDDTLNVTKYDLYALIHHRGGLGGKV